MRDSLNNYFKVFSILILVIFHSGCKKVDLENIDNLNNGFIDVIGHGGSGFQSVINPFPENSLVSIKNAVDGLNADGIEIDAQYSSDSILMLFHDRLLEDVTNCTGCMAREKSELIQNCNYLNNFGSRAVNNEKVVTVNELFNYFKNRKRKPIIYFSLKIFPECYEEDKTLDNLKNKFIEDFLTLMRDYDGYNWLYFYDGDPLFLNKLKENEPRIQLYHSADDFESSLSICRNNNFQGMVISNHNISKTQVKQAHIEGVKVVLWDIRTRSSTIEAIEKYPDAIMTDNVPMLIQILVRK